MILPDQIALRTQRRLHLRKITVQQMIRLRFIRNDQYAVLNSFAVCKNFHTSHKIPSSRIEQLGISRFRTSSSGISSTYSGSAANERHNSSSSFDNPLPVPDTDFSLSIKFHSGFSQKPLHPFRLHAQRIDFISGTNRSGAHMQPPAVQFLP